MTIIMRAAWKWSHYVYSLCAVHILSCPIPNGSVHDVAQAGRCVDMRHQLAQVTSQMAVCSFPVTRDSSITAKALVACGRCLQHRVFKDCRWR
jgi:hypothetical protein